MIKCGKCSHTWKFESEDRFPFFCHTCGWDILSQTYIPMKYKDFFSDLYETYEGDGYSLTKADFEPESQTSNTASDDPKDLVVRSIRISDILERSTPTNPKKWTAAKAAARAKFSVYPSAYANMWAAKKYKSTGGGWKKGKK